MEKLKTVATIILLPIYASVSAQALGIDWDKGRCAIYKTYNSKGTNGD